MPTPSQPPYPTRQTVRYRRGRRAANPLRRRHWYTGLIIVCGWILPPLAVAVRFGIGLDFFINILLTCLGWIPGHLHNFWIQNIRNNKNKRHSPAWAVRAGLVKDYSRARTQKRQWTGKYDDDGTTGGESHYGRKRWEQQDIIVDPVTGETRPDPTSPTSPISPFFSSLPIPWDDDPSPVSSRSSRRSHSHSHDAFEESLRGENRFSRSQSVRSHHHPSSAERDSVTGAVLDDASEREPRNTLSPSTFTRSSDRTPRFRRPFFGRRHHAPMSQQYAERYRVSSSSFDSASDAMHYHSSRELAGDGDALDQELQSDTLRSVPSTAASVAGNPFSDRAQARDRDALNHGF